MLESSQDFIAAICLNNLRCNHVALPSLRLQQWRSRHFAPTLRDLLGGAESGGPARFRWQQVCPFCKPNAPSSDKLAPDGLNAADKRLGFAGGYNDWMTVFMKFTHMSAAVYRSTRTAPTLAVALKAFLSAVEPENGNAMCSVIIRGYNLRVCRKHSLKAFDGKNLYTDLDFFIELTTIVREFGGKRWHPKYIGFQYPTPVSWAHLLYFPRAVFLFNQAKSWIELPRGFLKLPRQSTDAAGGPAMTSIRLQSLSISDAAGFIQALKRTLREHAVDGYPDINAAAKIMGTSVRTLQRALAKAGVTFSKVVEYARFEAAAEMLTDPAPKIIDIAYTLGYEDPSHFSRAFRRIAGQSPREFRLSRLAKPGVV